MKKSCNYYCFWHKGRKLKKNWTFECLCVCFCSKHYWFLMGYRTLLFYSEKGSSKCSPVCVIIKSMQNMRRGVMKRVQISKFRCVFSSPDPKGHVSYCHHWASVVCRPSSVRPSVRPSVNFSHFNQLLWSHWANLNCS